MSQWPPEPDHRRNVAAYICTELRANPYTSVPKNMIRSPPAPVVVENGLFRLGSLLIPASLCGDLAPSGRQPIVGTEHLVHLALHCLLFHSIGNGFNWIRGAALAHPESPFFAALWAQVAFAHVWPPSIGLATSCARPDMMRWCRGAYYSWLLACRRPGAIENVMQAAISATWSLKSPSVAAERLVRLVHHLQIACVPAQSQCTQIDITVNTTSGLCIARRDKCLLALHMFRGVDAGIYATHIPEIAAAKLEVPTAFQPTELGDSWLDEIAHHR